MAKKQKPTKDDLDELLDGPTGADPVADPVAEAKAVAKKAQEEAKAKIKEIQAKAKAEAKELKEKAKAEAKAAKEAAKSEKSPRESKGVMVEFTNQAGETIKGKGVLYYVVRQDKKLHYKEASKVTILSEAEAEAEAEASN